jgi:hypothetical protein
MSAAKPSWSKLLCAVELQLVAKMTTATRMQLLALSTMPENLIKTILRS